MKTINFFIYTVLISFTFALSSCEYEVIDGTLEIIGTWDVYDIQVKIEPVVSEEVIEKITDLVNARYELGSYKCSYNFKEDGQYSYAVKSTHTDGNYELVDFGTTNRYTLTLSPDYYSDIEYDAYFREKDVMTLTTDITDSFIGLEQNGVESVKTILSLQKK